MANASLGAFGLEGLPAKLRTPIYGRGGIPYTERQVDWTRWQQALQPYGFGYPGGFLGGPGEQPFTNIYAGQEPTQPWYMKEGLGGAAGHAAEVMYAWAGGGRPLMVHQSVASVLGASEEQMESMGYERTGNSWRATGPEKPPLPPPGGGGGGSYQPSYTVYRSGGRGVGGGQGYSTGLVNWRIGL